MASGEDAPETYPVEFALNVMGKGFVVLCCFPDPDQANVQAGDPVEFIRPDGSIFRTTVAALDRVPHGRPGLLGLVLPKGLTSDDVPYRSRLRLLNAADASRS
jgi:hypothetical protein